MGQLKLADEAQPEEVTHWKQLAGAFLKAQRAQATEETELELFSKKNLRRFHDYVEAGR